MFHVVRSKFQSKQQVTDHNNQAGKRIPDQPPVIGAWIWKIRTNEIFSSTRRFDPTIVYLFQHVNDL